MQPACESGGGSYKIAGVNQKRISHWNFSYKFLTPLKIDYNRIFLNEFIKKHDASSLQLELIRINSTTYGYL
jgi:hypothetical protein